jgi:hypothetical protein
MRDAEVIEMLRPGVECGPVRHAQRKVVETDCTLVEPVGGGFSWATNPIARKLGWYTFRTLKPGRSLVAISLKPMTSSHHRALRSTSVTVWSMCPKPLIAGHSMTTSCTAKEAGAGPERAAYPVAPLAHICRSALDVGTCLSDLVRWSTVGFLEWFDQTFGRPYATALNAPEGSYEQVTERREEPYRNAANADS